MMVQREVYLRNDLPCGSALCPVCPHIPAAPPPRLSIPRLRPISPNLEDTFHFHFVLIPLSSDDDEDDFESVGLDEDLTSLPSSSPPSSLPVYLVVDTNVALHQIDVLEHPRIRNLIFPQTVMEETKHRNPLIHSRIR